MVLNTIFYTAIDVKDKFKLVTVYPGKIINIQTDNGSEFLGD